MSPIFGIDFGTSNSALSVSMDGRVQMLDIDPQSPISNALKSILYFLKEEGKTRTYVGHQGVTQYIETEAEGRYMQSVKTFLPDPAFEKTAVFGKNYTLEDLIAIFLGEIKARGEALIQQEVTDLVLGRPVVFSTDPDREALAGERLTRAAHLAGFKHITFQMEPIAAALAHEQSLDPGTEQIVLVGDFGAGTSDFTIHKAQNTGIRRERKEDILSVGGVYIGGDSFDSRIMGERVAEYYGKNVQVKSMFSDNITGLSPLVIRKLMQWHHIPQLRRPMTLNNIKELKVGAGLRDKKLLENLERLIHSNYGYILFRAIEKTKCHLSDLEKAPLIFKEYNMAIEDEIHRTEFQEMILREVDAIRSCVDKTIADAGLAPDGIDQVFLTGGSSHIPMIRSIFEERLGKDKVRTGDAFTSVAYGLGLYAGQIS